MKRSTKTPCEQKSIYQEKECSLSFRGNGKPSGKSLAYLTGVENGSVKGLRRSNRHTGDQYCRLGDSHCLSLEHGQAGRKRQFDSKCISEADAYAPFICCKMKGTVAGGGNPSDSSTLDIG